MKLHGMRPCFLYTPPVASIDMVDIIKSMDLKTMFLGKLHELF